MPFYEYECSACKFYVEVLQKISDAPLKDCPSCGKPALTKLVSAPVFRLKGSGWYETDFKSEGENKRNLVDGGGDAKEHSSDSASESSAPAKTVKPAAKAADKQTASAKPAAKTPTAKPAKAPAKKVAARKAPAKKAAAKKAKPKS